MYQLSLSSISIVTSLSITTHNVSWFLMLGGDVTHYLAANISKIWYSCSISDKNNGKFINEFRETGKSKTHPLILSHWTFPYLHTRDGVVLLRLMVKKYTFFFKKRSEFSVWKPNKKKLLELRLLLPYLSGSNWVTHHFVW